MNTRLFRQLLIPTIPLSFWAALGFICGISYAHTSSILAPFCAISLSVLVCTNRKNLHSLTPILIFFGACILSYTHKKRPLSPFKSLTNVTIQAQVLDKTFLDGKEWRYRMLLYVTRFKYQNAWFEANLPLHLYTQQRPGCWVDTVIECGPLDVKKPDEPDYQLYLQKEGVGGSVFCQKFSYKVIHKPQWSLRNWLFWQRELLQIKLYKKMPPVVFSLFSSLFMGNKQAVASKLDRYKADFKIWGISHHLARSGLHLLVFILIWSFLFNVLPLPFLLKHLLLFGFTATYALFSWTSVSFMRAFGAYLFYSIALTLERRAHTINGICALCILILTYNPLYLFALDFQLSFLLSFCLLWIAHLMHQRKILLLKSVALESK